MERWFSSSIESSDPLSSRDDMASMELSLSSCARIGVPIDLRRVYKGISVVA